MSRQTEGGATQAPSGVTTNGISDAAPHGPDLRQNGPTGATPNDRPAAPRRRSAYATRDITQGSIPRTLWFLAWPQYLESSFQVIDQLADLVWAGLFGGFRAIAGIGAAQQFAQTGFTLRQGVDMSMRAMVSRAMGMRDPSLANHVVLRP